MLRDAYETSETKKPSKASELCCVELLSCVVFRMLWEFVSKYIDSMKGTENNWYETLSKGSVKRQKFAGQWCGHLVVHGNKKVTSDTKMDERNYCTNLALFEKNEVISHCATKTKARPCTYFLIRPQKISMYFLQCSSSVKIDVSYKEQSNRKGITTFRRTNIDQSWCYTSCPTSNL